MIQAQIPKTTVDAIFAIFSGWRLAEPFEFYVFRFQMAHFMCGSVFGILMLANGLNFKCQQMFLITSKYKVNQSIKYF